MCDHRWRRVYEEFILGGAFPAGWECVDCNKYIGDHQITPTGLSGKVLSKSARLVAPHGGKSTTSTGKLYREQIIDETGKLHIIED